MMFKICVLMALSRFEETENKYGLVKMFNDKF